MQRFDKLLNIVMKTAAFVSLLALAACSSFSEINGGKYDLDSMNTRKDLDRQLLVTFSDNTLKSITANASPTTYRQRGDEYYSSSWSKRVSNELAMKYGLVKLKEWSLTEIGMHCVIYRIPDKAILTAEIERLSNDDNVEIVQNVNFFNTRAASW
jgi:hypothetical protein